MSFRLAGTFLILAAILFWLSWLLMPGVGITDAKLILNIVYQHRLSVAISSGLQLASAAFFAPAMLGVYQFGIAKNTRLSLFSAVFMLIGSIVAAEPRGLIEIDVAEPWLQVWLVYYLRDRDVVLPQPTLYFTGFTTKQSRDLGQRARLPGVQDRAAARRLSEGRAVSRAATHRLDGAWIESSCRDRAGEFHRVIAQPFIALAVMWIVGLGPASVLARRLPRDAQVALAAPLTAALLSCASALVYLDVPVRPVVGAVLAALFVWTLVCAGRIPRNVRDYLGPALVAVVALLLAALPFLREGDWGVSTYGNMDPYLWVSQANSLLEGPPAVDASAHPDRIPYELVTEGHWATGLPFGVAAIAWLSRSDPADIYGAYAVVLPALLALAVFFCARGGLRWRSRYAAVAGAVVGANGYLLFGTFIGWQAQAALTTFGLLSAFVLWNALDRDALARERVLAAVFAVAGIATYGWTYMSFGGLLVAGVAGYLLGHRERGDWRRVAATVAGFALAVAAIGGIAVVQAARALLGAGAEWTTEVAKWWKFFDPALPSDALGFIPRTGLIKQTLPELGLVPVSLAAVAVAVLVGAGLVNREFLGRRRGLVVLAAVLVLSGTALAVSIDIMRGALVMPIEVTPRGWSFLAAAVAALVVASGLVAARSFENRRGDILIAGTAFFFAALVFMRVTGMWPMYSVRLMGYAVPVFTLLALAPLAAQRARSRSPLRRAVRVVPLAAGAALLAIGSWTASIQASNDLRTTDVAEEIARAALAAAPRETIEVDVEDGWNQAWIAYYLRDREISLIRPSIYFTGFTTRATRTLAQGADPGYRIERKERKRVAAAGAGELFLNRVTAGDRRGKSASAARGSSCRGCRGAA